MKKAPFDNKSSNTLKYDLSKDIDNVVSDIIKRNLSARRKIVAHEKT